MGLAAASCRSFVGLALLLAACACSPTRLAESARLGREVGAGTAIDASGSRRNVILAGQPGDLYLPAEPRAALLLVPGVTPEGRDDPRLIAFAAALARHGFLVFVPELPGLRAQRVSRDDPHAISAATIALASCFGPGRPPRLAIAAISYAVAPAILSALVEPDSQRVGLIIGIGSYHDAVVAITYVTTGYYRPAPGRPWRKGSPEPVAKWVFVLASSQQLPDPVDRALLSEIAGAKLGDPNADVSAYEAGLAPAGRAMMALAENTEPDRVPALVAALPRPVRDEIDYLDLSRWDLHRLHASVLLIHGRDDPLIPASESMALAAALPPGHADLYVVGNLSHVEIHPGGIPDILLLWQAAYRLLAYRDALTVPDPARCAIVKTSGSG